MTTFRNCYYWFSFDLAWKYSFERVITGEERLSWSRPIFFSYLWMGSSLKIEETSFIWYFYIIDYKLD